MRLSYMISCSQGLSRVKGGEQAAGDLNKNSSLRRYFQQEIQIK